MLSSLIGGLFGLGASNSTNQTNLQIARENREFEKQMYDLHYRNTRLDWQAQNEYNSPLSQKHRLEAAGLNPYLAMSGSGSAGVATSLPNAPTQPKGTVIPMQDPSASVSTMMGAATQAMQAVIQNRLLGEEIRSKQNENDTYRLRTGVELMEAMSRIGLNKSKRLGQNLENLFNQSSLDDRLYSIYLDNQQRQATLNLTVKQYETQHLNNSLLAKQLQYFDREKEAQIRNIMADTAVKYAQRDLTEAQRRTEIQRELTEYYTHKGIELSNDLKQATFKYTVNAAQYAAEKAYWEQFPSADQRFREFMHKDQTGLNGFITGLAGLSSYALQPIANLLPKMPFKF